MSLWKYTYDFGFYFLSILFFQAKKYLGELSFNVIILIIFKDIHIDDLISGKVARLAVEVDSFQGDLG